MTAVMSKHNELVSKLKEIGLQYHKAGRLSDALDAYQKALDLNPNDATTLLYMGVLAQQSKKVLLAEKLLLKSYEIYPRSPSVANSLGNLYYEMGKTKEALNFLNKSIKLNSKNGLAYYNRGDIYTRMNDVDNALKDFKKAFSLNEDQSNLAMSIFWFSRKACEWRDNNFYIEKIKREIDEGNAALPFSLLTASDDALFQKTNATKFSNNKFPYNPCLGTKFDVSKNQKIKIAYYSADFYNHATLHLMMDMLCSHDRDTYEIYAFSFGVAINDVVRKSCADMFDGFFDVSTKSDLQIAEFSRSIGVNIAVDLKGYTQDCRPGIFALRCAPIQINFLGYPGTSGASYMDYIVADKVLIPEDLTVGYSEKVLFLPCSYQVNRSLLSVYSVIKDIAVSRNHENLPDDAFVFCSFNNNYKICKDIFYVWLSILKRVDNSVLWLFEDNPLAKKNLLFHAKKMGIPNKRIIFAKRKRLEEHIARNALADVFLDTLAVNAHTTCSDALRMGVPVITLPGKAFASRVAASLVHEVGLDELIVDSLLAYEELAIKLATNPAKLRSVKTKLAENIQTSSLFKPEVFTRHIEKAYSMAFNNLLEGNPHDHIYVPDGP